MTWFSEVKARMRALRQAMLNRSATERDLDDEIRLHIELETDKNIRDGHSAREARRLALVAFGGIEVVKETHRDGRGVRWFQDLVSDTRFALRTLRRTPAFAVTAVVTIGLAIGATTAIVSVVNAVVLRPLPYQAPGQLVMLWEENPDKNWKLQTASPANFLDWKEQIQSLESTAAIVDFLNAATLNGYGEPLQLSRATVTGNFFSTLGVIPLFGRSFREEETWDTGTRSVMLSHRFWSTQFGARTDLVGKQLELNGRSFEVVGVLPASFRYPGIDPDIWTPTAFPTANKTQVWFRRAHYMRAIGRLRDGVPLATANAEIRTLMQRLEKSFPETNTHMTAGMTPLKDFLVGSTSRQLFILLSAVAVLLLIACANVANLLLVQAGNRQREVAVRLALGAGSGRLARQSLTESVVLSVVGGIAGLIVGWAGMRTLSSLQPVGMLPVGSIAMHGTEVMFALGLSALTGLLIGVVPSTWKGRAAPSEVLKGGGRGNSSGRRARRWGAALVVSEVSLAVLLTLGAGLLVKSYWQLQNVDPGFNPAGVATMSLTLPNARYDSTRKVLDFYDQLVERTRTLPGVVSAAVASNLPATQDSWSSEFSVKGEPVMPVGAAQVVHREISTDYPRVMGIKLLAGREFTKADRIGAPMVVLINEALAKKHFPNEDPIGKEVSYDREPTPNSSWRTIVGVIGSERQSSPAVPSRPEFFEPLAQDPRVAMTLVARTTRDPAQLAPGLRRIVSELDNRLAVSSLRTMLDVRAESVAKERFMTTVLLSFAVVGLVLAIVGVYGVMAQLARGRTREMGIRIALGAPVAGIQWLLVRYGLTLTAGGLAIGIGAAALSTNALEAMLFEVAPLDAATFVSVPLLLCLAAVIASWLPARRAARVDPSVTLRAE